MKITDASHLGDHELTAELGRLACCEREATVALIVHLAEFDARRLFEGAGFRSMFQYCRAVLHLSEDAVYNRIEAARAARRFPLIVAMLVAGKLSPTTVRLLAGHLTQANHGELLAAASGKGKRQVEELLVRYFPQPDVPASIRKMAAPPVVLGAEAETDALPVAGPEAAGPSAPSVSGRAAAPPAHFPRLTPRPAIRPLAAERYEIRFTASAELREKLLAAQDLLSHAVPSGDVAQIFDRALTLLVEHLSHKKFAETPRPRPSRGHADDSRYVPAAVRRAVWKRDGGRCAFVAPSGRRCDARRFLEFHHVIPFAMGGHATVDRMALRCRTHNGHEVELAFGPARRYRRREVVHAAGATDGVIPQTRGSFQDG
jgi:hypothetical protein